jgi:hypothetical protein
MRVTSSWQPCESRTTESRAPDEFAIIKTTIVPAMREVVEDAYVRQDNMERRAAQDMSAQHTFETGSPVAGLFLSFLAPGGEVPERADPLWVAGENTLSMFDPQTGHLLWRQIVYTVYVGGTPTVSSAASIHPPSVRSILPSRCR